MKRHGCPPLVIERPRSQSVARQAVVTAALSLAVVSGCAEELPTLPPDASPVAVTTAPQKFLQRCRSVSQLAEICPTKVPKTADVSFRRFRASAQGRDMWLSFAEWNAPHPGLTPKNAPPSFAHLNVAAWGPDSDNEVHAARRSERPWNGRSGSLILAPSYPEGGIEGDHLIYVWSENEMQYSVSLHAWEPLGESIATLKVVVESIPD